MKLVTEQGRADHLTVHKGGMPEHAGAEEIIAEECGLLAERLKRRARSLPPQDALVLVSLGVQLLAIAGS